ncbi:hypothetical protein AVEN_70718-1 [Araneus ventricosus]|uniref:Uncharacterized protein n=1 Tax=Araneus ventricosus TaxID=182803 RepID=A0A4Y2UJR5_ARAVE|nr:hypothetical protein AVEN_70718-1 [Araneus ventricosus]
MTSPEARGSRVCKFSKQTLLSMVPQLSQLSGTFTSVPIHFFGTQNVKPFLQCEVPMRSFLHLEKIWISKVVGLSFIPFEHKSEIRFFEACDKSPGWGSVGEEECASQIGEIRKGREGCFLQKGKIALVGTGVWME